MASLISPDDDDNLDWRYSGLVFCREFYNHGPSLQIYGYLFVMLGCGLCIFCIGKIYMNRQNFSVRQRAPLLSVVMASGYTAYIFLQLVFELIKANTGLFDWYIDDDVKNPPVGVWDLPWSRVICKFLYVYSRCNVTFTIFTK